MRSQRLSALSAVRKQHLLVEFSSLKYACPHGVFMSLTPGDPTLWSGVMFVRKGPYSPTLLRFQISFPPTYPDLPPLVTFSTDIFHPLITPLTTYMYTTDIQAEGTVSATDAERLPPGGFSLRDGFPRWFGRGARRSAERVRGASSTLQTPRKDSGGRVASPGSGASASASASASPTPRRTGDSSGAGSGNSPGGKVGEAKITTYEILRYIRSTFDDAEVLDRIPLEAAGNPGAWHAWRSYRVKNGISFPPTAAEKERKDWHDGLSDNGSSSSGRGTPEGYQRLPGGKKPGEWNWEGVWEVRVKRGLEASMSEPVLFGREAGDDLIRFLNLPPDGEEIEALKENIKRNLESTEPQRRGVV